MVYKMEHGLIMLIRVILLAVFAHIYLYLIYTKWNPG